MLLALISLISNMSFLISIMKSLSYCLTLLLIVFGFSFATVAEQQTVKGENNLSLEKISARITKMKNQSGIEEGMRQSILNALYETEDNVEELQALLNQIKQLRTRLQRLPNEIKRLKKKSKRIEQSRVDTLQQLEMKSLSISELEQRVVTERSALIELTAEVTHLEIQLAEDIKQPQRIRIKNSEIQSELDKVKKELVELVETFSNKLEQTTHKTMLQTRLNLLNKKRIKFDLESQVYPLNNQFLKLDLQHKYQQSAELTQKINLMETLVSKYRQREIEKEQEKLLKAQLEAEDKHPLIKKIMAENINYSRNLNETNKKLERTIQQKQRLDYQYVQLEKDYQSADKKIRLAGLSPALGNILREQKRTLPSQNKYQSRFALIQQEIAQVSLNQFHLDEAKKSLSLLDTRVEVELANENLEFVDDLEKMRVSSELRRLLSEQKELVTKLSLHYSDYLRALADADFSLQKWVDLGEKFRHFLNQHLLWVPSAPMIDQNYFFDLHNAFIWFKQPDHWLQLGKDLLANINHYPLIVILSAALLLLLIRLNYNVEKRLKTLLETSTKPYADRSSFTYYSLGYVVILSLPLPMLFIALAGLLKIGDDTFIFSQSVANGLMNAALPLLLLQFFYRLFEPQGIVKNLFFWHEDNISLLHNQIKKIRYIVVPAVFFIHLLAHESYYQYSYVLGRLALILAMIYVAYFFHRLAHPMTGVAKTYYLENPNSWLTQLRYIWYVLVICLPLLIIGFAFAGYYQSALELEQKMVILIRLVFFSALFHEIILRAMLLANRQLALKNARKKRQLLEHDEEHETGIDEQEPLLDIPKINEQSQKLLNVSVTAIMVVGCWLTLRDIVPAFAIFDKVVLWQHMAMVGDQETLQPITLINLFISFALVLLMVIFVKNFPGLVDLIFAGKYSMTAGGRYALIQLTRYTVVGITFIAIANELGGRWSQVQWLVAAVSVGLGFGLQEIFANMVSGIILLFERPIRVGDTVTVGDVTGKVCRIQMRATTITDWDQKELIVPNKTFITDKLVNWTLTDSITRVVIPIGVAYEADESLAQALIQQALEECPIVLKDPEPKVYFVGLGDSSLDFSARVFVCGLVERLTVTDEILKKVRELFKQHNIEIPYPQRDIHIRSSV